jgi:hypothetical protein
MSDIVGPDVRAKRLAILISKEFARSFTEADVLVWGVDYCLDKLNLTLRYASSREMTYGHCYRFFMKALKEDWPYYPEPVEPEIIEKQVDLPSNVFEFKKFKDSRK